MVIKAHRVSGSLFCHHNLVVTLSPNTPGKNESNLGIVDYQTVPMNLVGITFDQTRNKLKPSHFAFVNCLVF